MEKNIYTKEEVLNFLKHKTDYFLNDFDFNFDSDDCPYADFEELAREHNFDTIDSFDGELETETETFTTSNNEKFVVHCAYGYNY